MTQFNHEEFAKLRRPGTIIVFSEINYLLDNMPIRDAMSKLAYLVETRTRVSSSKTSDTIGGAFIALRIAAREMLKYHDQNTCLHDNRHRGGVIWTICDDCGTEWADDRGGFKPHVDSPAVANLRNLLK